MKAEYLGEREVVDTAAHWYGHHPATTAPTNMDTQDWKPVCRPFHDKLTADVQNCGLQNRG